jgi:DNA-binding transcriptional ArsR family regulator
VSDVISAMADPNRRRILELLRGGELTVTELASHFTVTRPAISQHLGVLTEAELVQVRREGKYRYYRLNPAGLASLRAALDAFWTTELEQLVAAAHKERGNTHVD